MAMAKGEMVEDYIITSSGVSGFKWGEKLAIKKTWHAARKQSGKVSPSGASASESSSKKKMPEGMEAHLRAEWKKVHGFNMLGPWLCNDEVMSSIYYAWVATQRHCTCLIWLLLQRSPTSHNGRCKAP